MPAPVTSVTAGEGPPSEHSPERVGGGARRRSVQGMHDPWKVGGSFVMERRRYAISRATRGAGVLAILIVALGAQAAAARTQVVRWSHPTPGRVAGFEIHWGVSGPGNYSQVEDTLPSPDAQGVYAYALTVGDQDTVYVTVRAYDADGNLSPFSREGTGPGQAPGDPGEPLPPPAEGALLYESFENLPTGLFVQGWVDTAANNSLTENDSLFGVVDLGGNRVFTTSSSDVNIHSHYVSGDSASWASYEVRGRVRIDNSLAGIGVTAYSQYTQQDAYYRLRRVGTEAFELNAHGPGALSCSQPNTGVEPALNQWYEIRLQIEPQGDGNDVRAKVWRQGDAEPASWQAVCHDAGASRPLAGTVGVWSMGSGTKYWDDLQVLGLGSGGSTGGEEPLGVPGRPILVGHGDE